MHDCSYNTEKNTWQEHYYVGMKPSPRRGHSCTFVANRKPACAAPIEPVPAHYLPCSKPASAATAVATCAPQYSSRELIVIGGAAPDAVFGTETVFAQVWTLDLDSGSWQELSSPGPAPPAVFGHTATLLRSSSASSCGVIVVIGGIGLDGLAAASSPDAAVASQQQQQQQQQHIHLLDLSTLAWSQLQLHPLSFAVPPLQGHTTVEDPSCPGRLLVFGGRNCSNSNSNRSSSSSDSASEAEQAELYTLQGTLWSRALLSDAPAAAPLLHYSCHKRRSGHVCCAWQPCDTNNTNSSGYVNSSSKGSPAALTRPCVLVVGGCSEGGGVVSGQVHALCDAPAARLRPVSAVSTAASAAATAAVRGRTSESSTDLWEHMRMKMHSVQAWQSGRYVCI
jgi:Galactose oxidase, central domain